MVDISLDSLYPFLVEAIDILITETVSICHLSPDKVAQPICPVKEHRVFNLLVFATAIKSHLLCQFYVGFQCGRRRWCQERVRPVALVKTQSLEERATV